MTDKMREEFEKWGKLNGYEPLPSYDMDKNPHKQLRSNVWHAFDGFQAGYNLREQEIQRLREALEIRTSFLITLKSKMESGYAGVKTAVSFIQAHLNPLPIPTKCSYRRKGQKPLDTGCPEQVEWVEYVNNKPFKGYCKKHKKYAGVGVFVPIEQALQETTKE